MQNAISDLWNGNIAPCEHCGARDGKTNTMFIKLRQERKELEAELTVQQNARLEQYSQLWEDYLLRMMELALRDGFAIGSRLAAEIYSER